jgi:hypothetical protein
MMMLTITEFDSDGNIVSKNDVVAHVINSAEDLHKLLDEAIAFKVREDINANLEVSGDSFRVWRPIA